MRKSLKRMMTGLIVTAAVAVASDPICSYAAGYPDRPVKLVVPFPAGGSADLVARAIADSLAKDFDQTVIVDNRPGANTTIAAQTVASAPPDGYTLFLCGIANIVLNELLYKKLPYDSDRDFRVLSIVTDVPIVMVVHPTVPAKTLEEFVAYAKQKGEKVNYASAGVGGPLHLATELFQRNSGIKMTHIPYKGSAQALTDVLAGRVDMMFDAVATSIPHIEAGSLRALGVSTTERVPALANVPTIAERGYPGFLASIWLGIAAPKKIPQDVAVRISAAIDRTLGNEAFRTQLEKAGYVVKKPNDEAAAAAFIAEDRQRWSAVIKSNDIRLD